MTKTKNTSQKSDATNEFDLVKFVKDFQVFSLIALGILRIAEAVRNKDKEPAGIGGKLIAQALMDSEKASKSVSIAVK